MTTRQKLAQKFNIEPGQLVYTLERREDAISRRSKRGWFYNGCWLGRSLQAIQTSTFWALGKLPGRDTF